MNNCEECEFKNTPTCDGCPNYIPLVQTDQTLPLPASKPKRVISVTPVHVKRLEAVTRAYNTAHETSFSPEVMNRALIDAAYSKL
jgi:hypothetical protein